MSLLNEGSLFDIAILLSAFLSTLYAFNVAEKRWKLGDKSPLFGGMRPIEAMRHIDEAVGRCAEMGVPAHFTAGQGLIQDSYCTAQVVAGLSILGVIAESCAKRGVKLIVTTPDAGRMPIEESIVRNAYIMQGVPEYWKPDLIRYTGWDQFAYATGAVTNILREKCAANFCFGYFYAEALYISEVGTQAGILQMAGPVYTFILTCDYFVIGEELMAAGAYASNDPLLVGAIVAQDITKSWIIALMVLGSIASFIGIKVIASLVNM